MKLFDLSEEYELVAEADGEEDLPVDGETDGDPEEGQKDPNTSSGETRDPTFFEQYGMWIILGVLVVLLIAWFMFSNRKNKSRQKEYVEQLEAIRPGNKVKTAGGICGIVVEICDDNTVIIETGSDASGKSYVKMDKELIAQTDAKGPTQLAREAAAEQKRLAKEGKQFPAPETSEEPSELPEATEEAPTEEQK